MTKELFREQQRYNRWDLLVVLTLYMVGITCLFVNQNYQGEALPNAMPASIYLSLVLPVAGMMAYFLLLKLSVKVTDKHISMSYFPKHKKTHKIKWENVAECKLLESPQPIGWSSLKLHDKRGKTYSFSGKAGLHIKTKKGEDIRVGVKRTNELEKALRQVFPEVQFKAAIPSCPPEPLNFWHSLLPARLHLW